MRISSRATTPRRAPLLVTASRALVHLRALAAGALAAALGLAAVDGCGGGAFEGGAVRGEGYEFRTPAVPRAWEPLEVEGAALGFRDRATDALVIVNARCDVASDDVPLASLTQHLFFQFTERQVRSQDVVPFDGREAMHTVLDAKLDGVPRSFDVWVLKKDGCVYDFVYVSPPEAFERGATEFRAFVGGFHAVSGGVER